MMVVVSYDIDTSTSVGEKTLRKVAKTCEAYGCRVQNSVFEVSVDPAQFVALKSRLQSLIRTEKDSVRFYKLGSNWRPHIESIGKELRFEQDGVIML